MIGKADFERDAIAIVESGFGADLAPKVVPNVVPEVVPNVMPEVVPNVVPEVGLLPT